VLNAFYSAVGVVENFLRLQDCEKRANELRAIFVS